MAVSSTQIAAQEKKCRELLEKGMDGMHLEPGKVQWFNQERFFEDLATELTKLNELNIQWHEEQEAANGN